MFKNLSIFKKILSLTLALSLFSAIIGVIGYTSLRDSNNDISSLVKYDLFFLTSLVDMDVMNLTLRRYEKDYLLNIGNADKQKDYLAKFDSTFNVFKESVDKLGKIITSDPHLNQLEKVKEAHSKLQQNVIAYGDGIHGVFTQIDADESITPQAANKMLGTVKKSTYEVTEAFKVLYAEANNMINEMSSDSIKHAESSMNFMLIVLLLSIAISVPTGIFIANNVTKPINAATLMLQDIATGEGDLTKRLNVTSQDEIGKMAEYFNLFIVKLQKTVSSIADNAATVAAAATELSATSVQISSSAKNMSEQSSLVSLSTEKTSVSVQDISQSANDISSSTEGVAAAIEEMSVSLNQVAIQCHNELTIAREATNHTKVSRELMAKLGEAAHSIGSVMNVIQHIAAQTNLLALNATIEAASAGEAGKGFAVVASEVKDLARQTAKATESISAQILDMQKNTDGAVKSIEQVYTVIEEVAKISGLIENAVGEQKTAMSMMASTIGQVSSGSKQVANKVSESAQNLHRVAQSVQGISGGLQETNQGIQQVKISSEDLAHLSESLNQLVRQFKI